MIRRHFAAPQINQNMGRDWSQCIRVASLGLLALISLTACSGQVDKNRPNILLITIDCLRYDRLAAYGGDPSLAPHINRLADEGVVFERAWAPMATTFPSHASMMTGMFPRYHGVRWNGQSLSEDKDTLAESLATSGYATASVVAYKGLHYRGHLDRGFDYASDPVPVKGADFIRDGNKVTGLASDWLAQQDQDQPFFLWTHYFEPHSPYRVTDYARTRLLDYDGLFKDGAPTEMLIKRKGEYLKSPADMTALNTLYDGELKVVNEYVGQLIASLDAKGLLNNTVVILTGDHGQAIGDRGNFGHGTMLWEAVLHVPFIVRDFRKAKSGVRVEEPIGVVDITPTVLELASAAPLAQVQGRSFAPALGGERIETHTYFAEVNDAPKSRGKPWYDPNALAVWSWPFKLEIQKGEGRLFDLIDDPLAENSIDVNLNPGVYEYLLDEAEVYLAKKLKTHAEELDSKDLEELRSLGYIQ